MTTNDDVTETPDYLRVTDRIPEAWGKYLAVADEWLPVIYELDAKLAEIDPTYEIHQVKEKFGGLRYYYGYTEGLDEDEQKRMDLLVVQAEKDCAAL